MQLLQLDQHQVQVAVHLLSRQKAGLDLAGGGLHLHLLPYLVPLLQFLLDLLLPSRDVDDVLYKE